METIALDFSLDVQERSNNKEFITVLKEVMIEYLPQIDKNKTTNKELYFVDDSGCEFQGHNIKLIEPRNGK